MKNNLQENNSRVDEPENQINDLEQGSKKQPIRKRRRIQINQDRPRRPWDNFKQSNICFIGVPEGDEKVQ